MKVSHLNASFGVLQGENSELMQVRNFLRVQRPGAYFEQAVQRGYRSPFRYFTKLLSSDTLLLYLGHLSLLGKFGIKALSYQPEFTEQEIDTFLEGLPLPFKPYDFQISAVKSCLLNQRQLNTLATGSGKSLVISLIAEFYRQHGIRGLLLVPNINLLTQFKSDIATYNLKALHERTETLGDGVTTIAECDLLISTWQSMIKHTAELSDFGYLICDECHLFGGDEVSQIIAKATTIKRRFGFTGTLPEDAERKMMILGLFNYPKCFITSKELIERGLACNVKITAICLKYPRDFLNVLRSTKSYTDKLTALKEYSPRNKVITKLACALKGNTLVLGSHIDFLINTYRQIMLELYGIADIEMKNITGKGSFEYQKQFGVYYLAGSDDSLTRECTRLILEHKFFKTSEGNTHDPQGEVIAELPQILVSNYKILSTGINIHRLHNMIFGMPMKSYNTVTQSIGRGMRLSPDKDTFNIYDIVDYTTAKGGVFAKSFKHRLDTSYRREQYEVTLKTIELGSTSKC